MPDEFLAGLGVAGLSVLDTLCRVGTFCSTQTPCSKSNVTRCSNNATPAGLSVTQYRSIRLVDAATATEQSAIRFDVVFYPIFCIA